MYRNIQRQAQKKSKTKWEKTSPEKVKDCQIRVSS